MKTPAQSTKPFKLAIAISGAVSLGSYEAGVMYEIIDALGKHNLKHLEDPANQIKIDVIVGASAGGMTAAVLAKKLMFEGDAFVAPGAGLNNPLYESWVVRPDIKDLLSFKKGKDNPNHSILSSGVIETIANDLLIGDGKRKRAAFQHPAIDDRVALGLALTNLNGLNHGIPVFEGIQLHEPDGQFVQTTHQDYFATEISPQTPDADWNDISDFARACGAFPFAFSPIELTRNKHKDYLDRHNLIFPESEDGDMQFVYTDGGVFNNYPLGMAKNLVDRYDAHRDYEKRFYLYVAPGPREGSADPDYRHKELFSTAKALAGGVLQQSAFQDWLMTSRINETIFSLDQQADHLLDWILEQDQKTVAGHAPYQEMIASTGKLLDEIYANPYKLLTVRKLSRPVNKQVLEIVGLCTKQPVEAWQNRIRYNEWNEKVIEWKPQEPKDGWQALYANGKLKVFSFRDRDKDYARLIEQYQVSEPRAQNLTEDQLKAWIQSIQVLELTARLAERDEMKIYTITAKDDQVIGELMLAFTGFLAREFREYDYYIGRMKARHFLRKLAGMQGKKHGQSAATHLPLSYDPPPELNAPAAKSGYLATMENENFDPWQVFAYVGWWTKIRLAMTLCNRLLRVFGQGMRFIWQRKKKQKALVRKESTGKL